MSEEPKIPDIFRAYEQGKHRRYNLLFAVNGGAFAVVKLMASLVDPSTIPDPTSAVVGSLTVRQLSLGMAIFTTVMVLDIFMFGQKMQKKGGKELDLFAWQGKLVLILIGLLIVAGWTLASFNYYLEPSSLLIILLIILVYLGTMGTVWAIYERQRLIKWLKGGSRQKLS